MKRTVTWLMLITMLFLMTACGSEGFTFDEEKLKSISKECMQQFVEKDFAAVEGTIKPSSRSKLNAQALKQAWEQTGEKLGDFVRFVSADVTTQNKTATVVLLSEFHKNGMSATFSFDTNYEIKALYMDYHSIVGELNLETDDYLQQEIQLGEGEEPLTGALTLPKGKEKPPVVIMVHGSGAVDLNESIGAADNRPFEDIAFGLAKRGIASIRYDKRNYAYPDTYIKLGKQVTIQDEVLSDVHTAITYAQTLASVDTDRIYILGHSLGGMLAPKIAQDHPSVAGLIIMAGSPRHLEDIVLDQNLMLLEQTNQSQARKNQIVEEIKEDVQTIKGLKSGASSDMYFNMPVAYWVSLNEIDTAAISSKLSIPVLIQQGDADFQISVDADYSLWRTLFSGKENVRFCLYEGLNHLFMPHNGKKDATEYDVKGHVEQSVIDDICSFIHQN